MIKIIRNYSVLILLILASDIWASDSNDELMYKHAYETYINLVNAEDAAEKTREIVNTAERAYVHGQKLFGEKSKNTALLAQNLALAYVNDRQRELARKTLFNALPIFRSAFGKKSKEIMYAYIDLVKYAGIGNKKALKYAKMAKTIGLTLFDSQSEELALLLLDLGRRLDHVNFDKDAREYLNASLEIFNINPLEHQNDISITNLLIGESYYNDWLWSESTPFFEKAYSGFMEQYPRNLEDCRKILNYLITAYLNEKNDEKSSLHLLNLSKLNAVNGNVKYENIYRERATYPKKALKLKLSGNAVIQFTINEEGSTENLEVYSSTDPIFEKPSLEAVANYKYAPKMVDGKLIPVPGVRVRTTFTAPEY